MDKDNNAELKHKADKEAPQNEKNPPQQPNPSQSKNSVQPSKVEHTDAKERFSKTMEEQSELSAQESGKRMAQKFMEGGAFLAGKKIAEAIWKKAEEYFGGGEL